MKDDTVTKVYAAALLELAEERKELDRVPGEVQVLQVLLDFPRADPLIQAFLESPSIERAEKARVLETVFRGKLSDTLVDFMLVVIRKGRALALRQMLKDFRALHYKKSGIVEVAAASAVPLSETSRAALVEVLERKTHKRVELECSVDPEILGGLVVRYDGMAADGSLRTALGKIAAGLKALKFGSQFIHEN
jgi:F-type H+-transporting ATPase subunit delta